MCGGIKKGVTAHRAAPPRRCAVPVLMSILTGRKVSVFWIMLILKANSERNGAFSGDSSTNSKSFEGKVHLHRSSLSDSKDVAKLQKNSETTKDKEQKKHCHRRVAEHELNRASQQQQPIEKGILIDKVGALSTTLPSNGSSLVSAAKVQRKSETTKDKEQKSTASCYTTRH